MNIFDQKILEALQNNGQLTNNELAEIVGLSASQCSRRRMSLEELGVISLYAAVLSPIKLGLNVTVFVQVTLSAHSPENADNFKRLIEGFDEIQEAYSLTGEADYMIKLILPDLKTLNHFLNAVILGHKTVARVHSSIVLETFKNSTKLPLKYS